MGRKRFYLKKSTVFIYLWPVRHSELQDGMSLLKHQWQPTAFSHSVTFPLETNYIRVFNVWGFLLERCQLNPSGPNFSCWAADKSNAVLHAPRSQPIRYKTQNEPPLGLARFSGLTVGYVYLLRTLINYHCLVLIFQTQMKTAGNT